MDMSNKTIKITHLSVDYLNGTTDCEVSVYEVLSNTIYKKVNDFSLKLDSSFQDVNDPELTLTVISVLETIDV